MNLMLLVLASLTIADTLHQVDTVWLQPTQSTVENYFPDTVTVIANESIDIPELIKSITIFLVSAAAIVAGYHALYRKLKYEVVKDEVKENIEKQKSIAELCQNMIYKLEEIASSEAPILSDVQVENILGYTGELQKETYSSTSEISICGFLMNRFVINLIMVRRDITEHNRMLEANGITEHYGEPDVLSHELIYVMQQCYHHIEQMALRRRWFPTFLQLMKPMKKRDIVSKPYRDLLTHAKEQGTSFIDKGMNGSMVSPNVMIMYSIMSRLTSRTCIEALCFTYKSYIHPLIVMYSSKLYLPVRIKLNTTDIMLNNTIATLGSFLLYDTHDSTGVHTVVKGYYITKDRVNSLSMNITRESYQYDSKSVLGENDPDFSMREVRAVSHHMMMIEVELDEARRLFGETRKTVGRHLRKVRDEELKKSK